MGIGGGDVLHLFVNSSYAGSLYRESALFGGRAALSVVW